jgi:hypothetical protein
MIRLWAAWLPLRLSGALARMAGGCCRNPDQDAALGILKLARLATAGLFL